ncbi:MAG: M17 family peptidase N-terminal domain-containing protein, partial [Acidimicrobiia bacterium]
MEINAAPIDLDLSEHTLIVGLMSDLTPVAGAEDVVESLDEAVLEAAKFEGKGGQTLRLASEDAAALLLVGLGEDVTFESLRAAVGNAVRATKTPLAATALGGLEVDAADRAVVEGAILGSYEFRAYKTEGDPLPIESLALLGADQSAIDTHIVGSEATNLARDWVNTPALDKAPSALAEKMVDAATAAGATTEVWDRSKIESEELGALLGVAAGSDRDPRVLLISHEPDNA